LDVILTFLAFIELFFILLLINAFHDPAFDVFEVLRVRSEGFPNITGFSVLFAALGYFKTLHGDSFRNDPVMALGVSNYKALLHKISHSREISKYHLKKDIVLLF